MESMYKIMEILCFSANVRQCNIAFCVVHVLILLLFIYLFIIIIIIIIIIVIIIIIIIIIMYYVLLCCFLPAMVEAS